MNCTSKEYKAFKTQQESARRTEYADAIGSRKPETWSATHKAFEGTALEAKGETDIGQGSEKGHKAE